MLAEDVQDAVFLVVISKTNCVCSFNNGRALADILTRPHKFCK